MYRCKGCGLAFVSPIPTDDYLKEFYARYHRVLEQGGGYELIEKRMEQDFQAKLGRLRHGLGPGRHRVLDVGCGKGHFVLAANQAGFEASGIDLSEVAVGAARANGASARCMQVEELAARGEAYDAVTFWATIEHVPDPLGTLSAIRKLLKSEGMLFLDTGVGDDLLERLLPGKPQWFDPPQHLYVFSQLSMHQALQRSGFAVSAIDPSFERNRLRRVVRCVRGLGCAIALRAVAVAFGLRSGPYKFTRYPLGNLMFVTAKPAADPPKS
jgi:SAM-dependent methyltransferase